jgi:predicted TIM-barrel fold metal-dependent hydrolase
MGATTLGRRSFLMSGTAVLAAASVWPREGLAQFAVPNSAGTGRPKLNVPALACDCHHHIYDAARFPQPRGATTALWPDARVEEFRLLQHRLGTSRNVVVTPSAYLTDNRVTLDAVARLSPHARGVAVVDPAITDADLKALHAGGIRGIRFAITNATISPKTLTDIESLGGRIAPLGWHLQFNTTADQVTTLESVLLRLPTPLVFDHMGHVSPAGVTHPAYRIIRRLIDRGRTWVKLSVTYDNTKDGPPSFADVNAVGQAFVKAAPERMLWGSNWPHPNETTKPDDAVLFDLLETWAPDGATRRRILVDNPATLYGFTPG